MKIIIDADACPVKDIVEGMASEFSLELIMVSNLNHCIRSNYARVITVDDVDQSADMAIINLSEAGDIVITQDYGLAALALAKGTYAIDPMGRQFTRSNIDGLLMQRYINQKARRAGERINGPKKRRNIDDIQFGEQLRQLILFIKDPKLE